MKKIVKTSIFILIIAAIAVAFVSCVPFSGTNNTEKGFPVYMELNGGSGVTAEDFVANKKFVKPAKNPVKSGYEFGGWYFDEKCEKEEAEFDFVMTEEVYVYAKWIEKELYADFFPGSFTKEIRVRAKNGKFAAPEVNRKGYEFKGWFSDSALKNKETEFAALDNAVFYAKWEVISYEIAYNTGGLGSVNINGALKYTVEDVIILPEPTGVAGGYRFMHWLDEDNKPVRMIEKGSIGARAFTAVFLSSRNYIEFVKGGTVKDDKAYITVPYSQETVALEEVLTVSPRAKLALIDGDNATVSVKEGDDNRFEVEITAESGNKKRYTVIVNRYKSGTATVTYRFNLKSQKDETRDVELGALAEEVKRDIAGYILDGWFTDSAFETPFNFNTPVTSSLTLYARYRGKEHNIKYILGIGTGHDNPSTYFTEVGLSLNDAEAPDGYKFAGWRKDGYFGDSVKEISPTSVSDVTLYATFELTEKHKYISEDSFTDGQEISANQITDIINWSVLRRKEEFKFTVKSDLTNREIGELVSSAIANHLTVSIPIMGGEQGEDDDASIRISSMSGRHEVNIKIVFREAEQKTPGEDAYIQAGYPVHGVQTFGRKNNYNGFKINSIEDTFSVVDTEQLFYAVENGYRPVPVTGSTAERIYNKAKQVLREIIDDDMCDIEKAHAIYDWIIMNVVYDDALYQLGTNGQENNKAMREFKGFYLEGVFDDYRAVCEGLSAAFVLMCRIEGIECIQVVGESLATGVGHAWNKIKIDGRWYVVCPTSGGTITTMKLPDETVLKMELLSHEFFMITDKAMGKLYIEKGEYPVADTEFCIYEQLDFEYDGKTYDLKVTSKTELAAVLGHFANSAEGLRCIDLKIGYETTEEELKKDVKSIMSGMNVGMMSVPRYDSDTQIMTLIIIELKND